MRLFLKLEFSCSSLIYIDYHALVLNSILMFCLCFLRNLFRIILPQYIFIKIRVLTQQVIYTCKTKFLLSLILWNYFWFFFATNEQLYISFHMKVDTRWIIEQCIFLWRFCACFWSATQMPNSRIQVSSSVTIPGTKTSVIKWAGNQNEKPSVQKVISFFSLFLSFTVYR